jgi:hypothetical protein
VSPKLACSVAVKPRAPAPGLVSRATLAPVTTSTTNPGDMPSRMVHFVALESQQSIAKCRGWTQHRAVVPYNSGCNNVEG